MNSNYQFSFEETNAFATTFHIPSYSKGILSNLTFSVKDSIDIQGYKSGCGNPDWVATHPAAVSHAICVEQLLSEGAECLGKTIMDELAFSLDGENYFYGVPVNPKALDRLPGGSSSGTASAVACNIVDFDLGTDAGGSGRIPASNCGLFGFRPSTGRIMNAGVQPFAPSFDTVSVCTRTSKVLALVAQVLLNQSIQDNIMQKQIYVLDDAWAMCDEEIQTAFVSLIQRKENFNFSFTRIKLENILGHGITMGTLKEVFNTIQYAETWSIYGAWITQNKPVFGTRIARNFENAKNLVRTDVGKALAIRENLFRQMNKFLQNESMLCFPTTPALAPIKEGWNENQISNYYSRALSIMAVSGLCRLPEITVPLTNIAKVPIGISFVSQHSTDMALISFIHTHFRT